MRVERLRLAPYGAFEDFALGFAPGARLHVVYGPNGAGKTTTHDAFLAVLFGMRAGERAFRYDSNRLRLGATLVDADGRRLSYLRRTSTRAPLWSEDDSEAVPEEHLSPYLAGFDRDGYERLFGLDLVALQQGGQSLLEGEGVGRALFSAAVGAERLSEVRRALDEVRADLFKPSGQVQLVPKLYRDHRELQGALRAATRTAAMHRKEKRLLDDHEARAAILDVDRRTRRASAAELRALAAVVTPLARHAELTAELERAGDSALDARVAAQVQGLAEMLQGHVRSHDESAARLRSLRDELDELAGAKRSDVCARATDIHALLDLRTRALVADDALVALRTTLATARETRASAARDARFTADASAPSVEHSIDALDTLADAHQSAALALQGAERALDAARIRAERARALIADVDARATEELAVDLDGLAPFRGTIADLAAIVLPADDHVDDLVADEAAAREAEERALERRAGVLQRLGSARSEHERAIDEAGGVAPSLDELRAARAERDDALERALLGEDPPPAARVVRLVRDADGIADLRAERSAAEEGQRARALALAAAEAALVEAEAEVERAEEARKASEARRCTALGPCGLDFASAASFRAWTNRRRELLRRVEDRRAEARKAAAESASAIEAAEADVKVAERGHGRALTALREWAERRGLDLDAGADALRRRARALAEVRRADLEVRELSGDIESAEALVAEFVSVAEELAEALGVHATFADDAGPTAPNGARAGSLGFASARADALHRALREAESAEARASQLERNIAAEEKRIAHAGAQRAEVAARLDVLAREHAGGDSDRLAERARSAEVLARAAAERERLERDLADRFEGRAPAALRAEIGERSRSELEDAASTLESECEKLDAKREALREEIAALKPRVIGTGDDEAARIDADRARIEADLVRHAERYVELTLADALLEREIRTYRESHRGPLLARAERIFAELTRGAYDRLHTSDDAGRDVLVARRPTGEAVPVGSRRSGLSEGTCDQLYLALRIATVEDAIEGVGPMPFVADDLFVNFDDERTAAALRVLAELGARTQVVVFTHHTRVVELARALDLAPGELDLIELAPERVREGR